jgi:4-amino-4-deoxy-L-arabinose transferase-like glycosyltransferase
MRLLLMVAAAWALRMVVVAAFFRDVADPVRHYEQFGNEVGWIARSIAAHQGFSSPFFTLTGPTALLPPVYPFILSVIFRVFGIYSVKSALTILTLNSLFSALTCVPIYLATRLSVNARVAMFAGWGWAIYPFAIYFSAGRVWEFSLTSLLVTTCFWLALSLHLDPRPAHWLGFGTLYGLAGLCNPAVFSLFPVLLLLPLWRLWKLRRAGSWFSRDVLHSGLLAAVGLFVVLTPWTVRNYRTMHVLCPVRDGFWYEFWSANNGDNSNPNLAWTHPASNPYEMQIYQAQGEIAYIAQKRVAVKDYVSHHPGFFVRLTLRRVVNYWTGFWSLAPSYREQEPFQLPNVFYCTSLTLLLLIGARNWWRRDRDAALPYLLAIAIFPIAYYISHPLMDYRQPIEPEIVILVVVGLRAIKTRVRSRLEENSLMRESEAAEVYAQMSDSESFPMEHTFDADDCSCPVCIEASAAVERSATAG